MTNAELLEKIKIGLMITNSVFDDVLLLHIEEVKDYIKNAGVSESIVDSERCVGVIFRGVSDLWNNGSGTATLSPYFRDRVVQLSFLKGDGDV